MSKVLTDRQNLTDIADAIREKGVSGTFKPSEMAGAIESIGSNQYSVQYTINSSGFVTNAIFSGKIWNIIPYGMFCAMPNLVMSELPDEIQMIADYAFYNCSCVTFTSLPYYKIRYIGPYAFYNCIEIKLQTIPIGVTAIYEYTFYNCTKLALTSLPNAITSIGEYAFYGCRNITLKSLPGQITSIGNSAFRNCAGLNLTSLPSGLNSIGTYAFSNCTRLTSIKFNSTPTSIATNAFSNCTNLTSIKVPWAQGAVSGAPWGATNATITYDYTGS